MGTSEGIRGTIGNFIPCSYFWSNSSGSPTVLDYIISFVVRLARSLLDGAWIALRWYSGPSQQHQEMRWNRIEENKLLSLEISFISWYFVSVQPIPRLKEWLIRIWARSSIWCNGQVRLGVFKMDRIFIHEIGQLGRYLWINGTLSTPCCESICKHLELDDETQSYEYYVVCCATTVSLYFKTWCWLVHRKCGWKRDGRNKLKNLLIGHHPQQPRRRTSDGPKRR